MTLNTRIRPFRRSEFDIPDNWIGSPAPASCIRFVPVPCNPRGGRCYGRIRNPSKASPIFRFDFGIRANYCRQRLGSIRSRCMPIRSATVACACRLNPQTVFYIGSLSRSQINVSAPRGYAITSQTPVPEFIKRNPSESSSIMRLMSPAPAPVISPSFFIEIGSVETKRAASIIWRGSSFMKNDLGGWIIYFTLLLAPYQLYPKAHCGQRACQSARQPRIPCPSCGLPCLYEP